MAGYTAKGLSALKPKAKPYKVAVDTGLLLRVSVDGTKSWVCWYIVDGKRRETRLGVFGDQTGELGLADAKAEAARIRSLARKHVDFQVQEAAERAAAAVQAEAERTRDLTVGDLMSTWIADGVRRGDGNKALQASFDRYLLPEIGSKRLRSLTDSDIRAMLAKIVRRGANRTAVLLLADLKQMLRWAEQRAPWRRLLVEGNPAVLVDAKTIVSDDYEGNVRSRILSVSEIRTLRDALAAARKTYEASADRRVAVRPLSKSAEAAVWLALSTMCRVGELSMAQFEHIDGNVWTIPGSSTKNGKPHVIYLSDFAQSQIEVLREEAAKSRSKWLFPNQAKTSHVDVKALSKQIGDRQKAITGAKRLAGRSPANDALVLPGGRWTMHDLRRTGASLMASLGVTPLVIDKCLNHVPGNVLHRVYQIHDYADEKRAAWNQLGQRLESILDGGHVVMLRRA